MLTGAADLNISQMLVENESCWGQNLEASHLQPFWKEKKNMACIVKKPLHIEWNKTFISMVQHHAIQSLQFPKKIKSMSCCIFKNYFKCNIKINVQYVQHSWTWCQWTGLQYNKAIKSEINGSHSGLPTTPKMSTKYEKQWTNY